MSKKQGRSRSLVRESDVADIWSNWSDVLQNTSVCSLIDKYIYIYICICTDSFLWTHRLCWVFHLRMHDQCLNSAFQHVLDWEAWLRRRCQDWNGPKRMIYDYDGFRVLSMFTAKGSLNNTVLWFLEPGILLPLLFFFDIHSFKASREIGCYNLTWSCSFASPNDRQV